MRAPRRVSNPPLPKFGGAESHSPRHRFPCRLGVATSPRPQRPLIFDREALRAFARSLRSPLTDTRYYLTLIYPRTFCGPWRPSIIRAARLLVSSSFPSLRGSDLTLVRATQRLTKITQLINNYARFVLLLMYSDLYLYLRKGKYSSPCPPAVCTHTSPGIRLFYNLSRVPPLTSTNVFPSGPRSPRTPLHVSSLSTHLVCRRLSVHGLRLHDS